MHEMSIVASMLSIVRDEMRQHNVQRLLKVKIRYGALVNIVPEALSFAFEALTKGTSLDGATLESEEVPVVLRCSHCNALFSPEGKPFFFTPCPSCDTQAKHSLESGQELYVQSIEAE